MTSKHNEIIMFRMGKDAPCLPHMVASGAIDEKDAMFKFG